MIKIAVVLTLIQTFLFVTYGQDSNHDAHKPHKNNSIKIFVSPSDILFAFDKSYSLTKLSTREISAIDSITKRIADSLNILITTRNIETGMIDTLHHVFQVVAAQNRKGEKVVWVNAICDPPKDWQKGMIYVEDGGSCYYNFRIDLNRKQYFQLSINSNA